MSAIIFLNFLILNFASIGNLFQKEFSGDSISSRFKDNKAFCLTMNKFLKRSKLASEPLYVWNHFSTFPFVRGCLTPASISLIPNA